MDEQDSTYFELYFESDEILSLISKLKEKKYDRIEFENKVPGLEGIIFNNNHENTLKINQENKTGILFIDETKYDDFIKVLTDCISLEGLVQFLDTEIYIGYLQQNNNLK